jgi:hypothetical protein
LLVNVLIFAACPLYFGIFLCFGVEMGSTVIAACPCGLDTGIIMIGGGMHNFTTVCVFPCLCVRCHAVVTVNLFAKRKRCPQCRTSKIIPYDDPIFRLPDPVGLELGTFKCIAFWYLSGFFVKKIIQYAFPNSEY